MSLLSQVNGKHMKLVKEEEAENKILPQVGLEKIMMIEKMMKKILLHY